MGWPYSQMTDLASLFDIWRLGTAQVFTNLLHIVRLIRRQSAGDNCVNVGLDDVLPLPPSESGFAKGLCCADSENWCPFFHGESFLKHAYIQSNIILK